ncbi:Hypothetical predicted protein [Podarcis lilfordi]|uniref:Uncharacterized protein n=1 Tax=Podarcis lilfordi TaxID=74358 RepID=A0AA35JWB0_9SAUR|nr:Hypothetical predicted protein [Podarcis lilfordi]
MEMLILPLKSSAASAPPKSRRKILFSSMIRGHVGSGSDEQQRAAWQQTEYPWNLVVPERLHQFHHTLTVCGWLWLLSTIAGSQQCANSEMCIYERAQSDAQQRINNRNTSMMKTNTELKAVN